MKVKAHAKVNLALEVKEKRTDGYHEMDMIMAPIELYDVLDIEPNGQNQDVIVCEEEQLPQNNTLMKTLDLLRKKAGLKNHYKIKLTKNIPSQAGLGGASADAAALIHALDLLEDLQLSDQQKKELGAQIGADVPFCLCTKPARVQGIGEIITPVFLPENWSLPILLVKPAAGVSTPACFARLDAETHDPIEIEPILKALKQNDLPALFASIDNAMEAPARDLCPALLDAREELEQLNLDRVLMTGSGSTLMGFSQDESRLEQAAALLKEKRPDLWVWKGNCIQWN